MMILIKIKGNAIYKIQRTNFKNSDAENIINQLRFVTYNDGIFECEDKTSAALVYSLFTSKVY